MNDDEISAILRTCNAQIENLPFIFFGEPERRVRMPKRAFQGKLLLNEVLSTHATGMSLGASWN
jgi:hypothetical protein